MKAARTSVLSCRWKYLWTHSTSLNFDASEKLFYAYKSPRKLQVERYKYMVWVTKVLDLHQDSNINEFRVRFDLTDFHRSVINYWIFAAILEKRVAKFELILRPYRGSGYYLEQYELLQEYFDKFKSVPHYLTSLESLRCLCLEGVNISQEILEFFIHNCPFLEQLRVAYSSNFSSLEVVGSSLRLKYLDIQCCFLLEEIEISAPSLLSFKYIGGEIKLHVDNVPQLVHVSIGGSWWPWIPIRKLVDPIISFLAQLKSLELHLYSLTMDSIHFLSCGLPRLRHLTMEVVVGICSQSLVGLISSTMKACSYLQKLTLKLVYVHGSRREEVCTFPKCSHQNLKVVELLGFFAVPVDLELAVYLLENATALEKMIVEISSFSFWSRRIEEAARERAKIILSKNIRQEVQLVIR